MVIVCETKNSKFKQNGKQSSFIATNKIFLFHTQTQDWSNFLCAYGFIRTTPSPKNTWCDGCTPGSISLCHCHTNWVTKTQTSRNSSTKGTKRLFYSTGNEVYKYTLLLNFQSIKSILCLKHRILLLHKGI